MKKIDLGLITFEVDDCVIGASVSGGADSALLLYLLMKHSEKPIHIITCGSLFKFCKNPKTAINIIEKCIRLTGNKNIKHHTFFLDSFVKDDWIAGCKEFLDNKTVDKIYTGFTAIPPTDVTEKFNIQLPEPLQQIRDPNVVRNPRPSSQWYIPFTNLTKKQIYELYKQEGLLETLFPLTNSCEDPAFLTGHCGKCWWCEERKWGFGQL